MKHIVSFSGGKDSTAMLLIMLEKGMRVDEIIFLDTGKEFPAMYKHIDDVEKYIGRQVIRLKNPRGFDYWMFDHKKTKGKNIGKKGYGWPDMGRRWCTGVLKRDIFLQYLKKHHKDVTEYHGIAFDEPERMGKNNSRNIRFPLFNWVMTEKDCLEYCYDRGFRWDGLYENFTRVSCWCCPIMTIPHIKSLWKYHPELWAKLKDMDKRAYNSFRRDYTLEQLESRFQAEDNQMNIYDYI